MTQKRKPPQRSITGWVIFDKPYGMGSTDAVSLIKRLYRADKAGHAGTLDPLASGLLPIALGEATKTVPYIMNGAKIYQFIVTWGEERRSDDLEGEIVQSSHLRPSQADIEKLLPRFTGIISQVPPQFSAIKVNGMRAYDLARNGEEIQLQARDIEIDRINILDMSDNTKTTFEIECSKGTYVRSIARDMGRILGCFGHVSALKRTQVEPFDEKDAVTIDELTKASEWAQIFIEKSDNPEGLPNDAFHLLDAFLINPMQALEGLPHVILTPENATRVRLGNPVLLLGRDAPLESDEAYASLAGVLVAIGEIKQGQFHPRRVLK
jgi:tRNA pseudouridine55 synthase